MTFPENQTVSTEPATGSRSLLLQRLRPSRSSPKPEAPRRNTVTPGAARERRDRVTATRDPHRALPWTPSALREQRGARALCQRERTPEKGGSVQHPTRAFPSLLLLTPYAPGTYAAAFVEICAGEVFTSQHNLVASDKGEAMTRRPQACRRSSTATYQCDKAFFSPRSTYIYKDYS